jgi:malate dehydrogenase (oxaloacetate-decarboxylating)(NADP+)
MEHNLPYAHDFEQMNLINAIDTINPHILIGATGAPGTFTKEVIEHMSANNDRPVIFALSNPTDRAECTAEEAYNWSSGKAVFASGSPFSQVDYDGHKFKPGQGNNAYIFPGIGLGAVVCCASKITDSLFLTAAKILSEFVSEQDINDGSLYPPLKDIREVSLHIAVAVAEKAYDLGLARNDRPDDLKQHIADYMYEPKY